MKFGKRSVPVGGDVLSVELELPERDDGEPLPIEEMERPEKIFEQFHRAKFDGEPPDETLAQTFSELVQLVEETE